MEDESQVVCVMGAVGCGKSTFLDVLNKIRIGNVSKTDLDFINKRYMCEPDEEILHITTTRKSAYIINLREYNALEKVYFLKTGDECQIFRWIQA